MEQERLAREKEEQDRMERTKKIKDQFKDQTSQWEKDKNDIQDLALKEKAKELAKAKGLKAAKEAKEAEEAEAAQEMTDPQQAKLAKELQAGVVDVLQEKSKVTNGKGKAEAA